MDNRIKNQAIPYSVKNCSRSLSLVPVKITGDAGGQNFCTHAQLFTEVFGELFIALPGAGFAEAFDHGALRGNHFAEIALHKEA